MPIFDPEIFLPDLFIAGASASQRNIFRGQCIGVSVDEIASDIVLTLDLEDYNRLPPLVSVGHPTGDIGLTQDDGTVIWIDPGGQFTGVQQAFDFSNYWPGLTPNLDFVTGFLAPEVPGLPVLDWGAAQSNLKAFIDFQAQRVSGALRWWLAPHPTDNTLIVYWVDYLDPLQTVLLPAPYNIDNDNPDWTTTLMPTKFGPCSWDWAGVRGRVYVNGGTPAPEGSGWTNENTSSSRAGDGFVDAPGSITEDDRNAIGNWHLATEFVELLTATAVMLPASPIDQSTYIGWAPGQTILITSAKHSRFVDHELDERPTVIQKVSARLVTPSPGIGMLIDNVAVDPQSFEWRSLTWAASMSNAEKATVVIHLLGDADTLLIPQNADVLIRVDDELPLDIEWTLQLGDVPKGALTRELAKAVEKPVKPPNYRFNVTVRDPDMLDGGSSEVAAQIADGSTVGSYLAGVPIEWVLLQWEDDAETVPGDVYELTDDIGTTDTAGRVFNTMTRDGTPSGEYHYEVLALALPIVP